MQRMAAKVSGSKYVCLAGAGHIANVEAPQGFNEALIGFLRRRFPEV
jgi:pimeloyl-ACP methyl ester carboxylesterase